MAALLMLMLLGACSGTDGDQDSPTGPAAGAAAGVAVLPDFDGDGRADLVAGVGEAPSRVAIRYAGGRSADLRRADLDGSDSATFGRALLATNLNGDEYTDLVVGDPASAGSAAVFLVPGSDSGLDVGNARVLQAPAGLVAFGQSLALLTGKQPLLAVGAPGDAPAGVTSPARAASEEPVSGGLGGAVAAWELDSAGRPVGEPTVMTQRSLGLPGEGAGDAFGATLAASRSWLAVGAPRKDVGGVRDAGAVIAVDVATDSPVGRVLTQGSGGVPGRPEAEDRFGFALAADDRYLAAGVPMDDEDGMDAGLVQPFRLDAQGPVPIDPVRPSDLGQPESAGALFGFSLAMAGACSETPGLIIGAPATAVGGLTGAGAAWLVPLSGTECSPRELTQGGALGSSPTEMASVGLSVSAWAGPDGAADTVVLAAPGNAEEGVPGRVLILPAPYSGPAVVGLDGLRLHEEGTLSLSPTTTR